MDVDSTFGAGVFLFTDGVGVGDGVGAFEPDLCHGRTGLGHCNPGNGTNGMYAPCWKGT